MMGKEKNHEVILKYYGRGKHDGKRQKTRERRENSKDWSQQEKDRGRKQSGAREE